MSRTTSKAAQDRSKARVKEALAILRELGFPSEQLNERSALTLLALLDVGPDTPWSFASNPLCGITPMMEFFRKSYGKRYKPNTRETVRRFTVHQFCQAGLVLENPDDPSRPVNSPDFVYQIAPTALDLLRTFKTERWQESLKRYLHDIESLRARYEQERQLERIPVTIASGKTLSLTPGKHNELVQKVLEVFMPAYCPGGQVLYVGDTGDKMAYLDERLLESLGAKVDHHGKMPDIAVYHAGKGWLVLVEAVTSHGPVNPKRHFELNELFRECRAGLVFVTAFLTRRDMTKYLGEIAWETEVWVAESPTHMIHFNGERFLGPHGKQDADA